MPQNTPMKRQFTTIDGRTVMSNLPQHWGGNDWAITGVDNPLPVGNYVQTEAGVWIPQKGSDDGAADVRLTGSREELITRSFYNIAPGEEVSTDHIKTLDYTSFYVALWRSGTGSNIEIFKRERTSLSVVTPDDVKVLEAPDAMRQSEPEKFIGSTIRFRLRNTGDATANTVYFVVYGIK